VQNENPDWPAYKKYFMHGTSHHLGLDTHDYGLLHEPMQPNMVFTVEPGIYIGPDIKPFEGQPEISQKWRGIGIRIEDDILVTENGPEVLTAAVPKLIEDLEH
jgi:Xaa-Pro aminopeptidase